MYPNFFNWHCNWSPFDGYGYPACFLLSFKIICDILRCGYEYEYYTDSNNWDLRLRRCIETLAYFVSLCSTIKGAEFWAVFHILCVFNTLSMNPDLNSSSLSNYAKLNLLSTFLHILHLAYSIRLLESFPCQQVSSQESSAS